MKTMLINEKGRNYTKDRKKITHVSHDCNQTQKVKATRNEVNLLTTVTKENGAILEQKQ